MAERGAYPDCHASGINPRRRLRGVVSEKAVDQAGKLGTSRAGVGHPAGYAPGAGGIMHRLISGMHKDRRFSPLRNPVPEEKGYVGR